MKNTIIGLFLGLVLLAPSFSYAQVVDTPATTADLDSLKAQLISLLLQEVQLLQAQLTALQDQQNTTAADVATIKANTTPTGGATDNTVKVPPFTVYQLSYAIDQGNNSYIGYRGSDPLSSVSITQRKDDVYKSEETIPLLVEGYSTNTSTLCPITNSACGGYIYKFTLPQGIQTPGPYKVVFTSISGETATWLISLGYSGSQGSIFVN